MQQRDFAGTVTLIRLFLRRDRALLPIWVLLPGLIVWGQVSFVATLPDWQAFLAELSANPVTSAWLGPVVPLTTAGAIIWRGAIQGAMVVMIGSVLTLIRHTRTEEEAGRSELIRGGVVGRHAALTAALALTCAANLVAGLLATFVLIGGGLPAGGAMLAGLTIAAAGWFFSGVGALSAQLREHAGGARGVALAVLGLGLVPMVVNNVGGGYTGWAWFAPMIWYRLTQPFAGNQAWVVLVFVLLSAIPMAAAYTLSARRDLGAGLLPPRTGPAEAAPGLRSPLALAWRLHRSAILSWAVGLIFVGGAIGLILPTISESLGDMLTELWPDRWVDMVETVGNREAFMAVSIYILAVGAIVYAIVTVLRLRAEETEHLADVLLASPVSRMRWMSSYLIMAFAGSAFLLLALGGAAGLGWGLAAGDVGRVLPRALGMSLSKIPVVWVMAGTASLLYGLLPRAVAYVVWSLWALFVLIEMLWEAQVVGWPVLQLTPFAYAHYTIPVAELPLLPLFGLAGLAALFTGIGLVGFQHRDIG